MLIGAIAHDKNHMGAPGVIAGKCTVSHLDQGDKIRLKPSGDVA